VLVASSLSEVPLRPDLGLLEDLAGHRAVVHQAAGMLSVQLGVSLAEGLVALRARSYADGRPVGDLATEVVSRRLRFEK
jgi:hypothetical protein